MLTAGTDEVGKGAFAGPVVVGVVAFEQGEALVREKISSAGVKINDSKKLTQKQREISNVWIKNNAYFATGEAWAGEIDRVGIVSATNMAYRRAVKQFAKKYRIYIEKLFTDAFYIPYLPGVPKHIQFPVVRGDALIFQISAASIVAKVYRDSVMSKLHASPQHAKYFWHDNKGYGTLAHRQAIATHGICQYHRKQFVRNVI